jgi:hypothetical protein
MKTVLLRFGGDFLVAPPPTPDLDIPALLERGFITSGPGQPEDHGIWFMPPECAAVWTKKIFGIISIATGYALSDDGLWRQHSWGILREGVLETTKVRVKYFGILLQGQR